MSGLLNCRRCGRIYAYAGKPICPTCIAKEDEDFETARDFIKENPGKNLQEVSDETGVSVKMLTKFLREGRIEFADGSTAYLSCESCGAPIYSGRLCNNCLGKLGKEIMDVVPSRRGAPASPAIKDKDSKGMHLTKFKK